VAIGLLLQTRSVLEAYVCRVVRFSIARCILIQITVTPSDMGDTCSLESFRRSANSIMVI
jgi:hypothetical protein